MSRIVDPRNVRPIDLQPGDVMVRTVALHILENPAAPGKPQAVRHEGKLVYRMYVCDWPGAQLSADGVPQGCRLYDGGEQPVGPSIFPVVGYAEMGPDEG